MKFKDIFIDKKSPLTVILGPCSIESEDHALLCAEFLKKLTSTLDMQFIFKASYDKANRSSIDTFRGVGIDMGLKILQKIQNQFDVPVTSDVHLPDQAKMAGEVLDILQIPAFLCRQTDLILAAAETKKVVNVKKGQFIAPQNMKQVIDKIQSVDNDQIILTERGFCFGYNNLVSDMRSIPIMQKLSVPVCFDASHSVQFPGGLGEQSSGQREFIPTLTKAAIAAGADLLFIEAHPDPSKAKSDKDCVYPFDKLEDLLKELIKIYNVVNDR